MTTLKIGIADTEQMKARTLRIARGEEQPSPDDPKVWFISTDLSPRSVGTQPRNAAPDRGAGAGFLDALAELTGRANQPLTHAESDGRLRPHPHGAQRQETRPQARP
jgi:predicted transcriptional regulator